MSLQLHVFWFLISPAALVISQQLVPPPPANMAPSPTGAPRPSGCATMCGDVEVPYPFGIGANCSWKGEFPLTCNHSFSPPRLYAGVFEVLDVSLEAGEGRVFGPVWSACYNSSNTTITGGMAAGLDFTGTPGLISSTRNEFTAIGCSTVAFLQGRRADGRFSTGCISTCGSLQEAAHDGAECTGLGCCQMHIPPSLSMVDFAIQWSDGIENVQVNLEWTYSPCSYAFVAEKGWYNFSRQDLLGMWGFTDRVGERTIPVVIDWAIRTDGPCKLMPDASGTSLESTASACVSTNSYCTNATQGLGYLCKCFKGYTGNPYIVDGCTNINECELRKSNPATYEKQYPCASNSKCHDQLGDYECRCKFWHTGDGKSEGGCRPIIPLYVILLIVAITVAVALACLAINLLLVRKRREQFNRNGGDILKGAVLGFKIYTNRELTKITDHYSNPIGEGHFGKVYKGKTIDHDDGNKTQQVAVKCSVAKKEARRRQKLLGLKGPQHEQDRSWKDLFVNEITFQFQIRHPNVVRLLGCCLEADVPILVFEFVSNGSLHDKLHGACDYMPGSSALPLLKRLDIAIGAAEALSHMHSHGEHKHVHGDIKPANILLDDDLNAKVSDFGSSKLLSADRYAKDVAADGNYADPVYYKTGRFTVESDVYSFGVVLLELITRKTARYGDNKSLAIDFVRCCKEEGKGRLMYDKDIFFSAADGARTHGGVYMECLDRTGALAVRCLNGDADERPSMAEVVEELKQVRSIASSGGS